MKIRKVSFRCIGQANLMFGKPVHEKKRDDETADQFEERTWKERCHVDEASGVLYRPGLEFQKTLCFAASWLSMKMPGGGGKKTYTKRFGSGVRPGGRGWFPILVNDKPAKLGDVGVLPLYVPSGGEKGGSKRVWRKFPILQPGWTIDVEMVIVDEAITEDVFVRHAQTAGIYDGLGSMRVGRQGPNGIFICENFVFTDLAL
jgi:hypothetical protein